VGSEMCIRDRSCWVLLEGCGQSSGKIFLGYLVATYVPEHAPGNSLPNRNFYVTNMLSQINLSQGLNLRQNQSAL